LDIGTSGKGLIALGKVAKNLLKGDLVVLPRSTTAQASSYTVFGDVTINNTIVAENQTIIMDVGTDNIQGYVSITEVERTHTDDTQPNRDDQKNPRLTGISDQLGS
jgi:hypothetical protein